MGADDWDGDFNEGNMKPLAAIKSIDNMLGTDIRITWDKLFKVYQCEPITKAGKQYCKNYKGVIMKKFGIPKPLFQKQYETMIQSGLIPIIYEL